MTRSLYLFLFLAIASALCAAAPDYNPAFGKDTTAHKWQDSSSKWVAEKVGGPSVAQPTPYYANLSTSTPTLLSDIASWSAGDLLEIQVNNVAFRCAIATTTAATVLKSKRMGQWDTYLVVPAESSLTWNQSYIASVSAQASISVDVYPPRP